MEKNFLDKKIEETVKETLKEYRNFAFKEDVKKVCIAVVLGTSFDNLIKNISINLIMPFFEFLINQTNGTWRDYKIEIATGLYINFGKVIGGIIDFIIISLILFFVVKIFNKDKKNNSYNS